MLTNFGAHYQDASLKMFDFTRGFFSFFVDYDEINLRAKWNQFHFFKKYDVLFMRLIVNLLLRDSLLAT